VSRSKLLADRLFVDIFDAIVAMTVFWLGAAIGSFLNVVVYRVPANLSVIWPPSRCPKCLHQLGMGENIPILGWLLLRGKCRHCKTSISPRYPLVEAATAIVFLIVYHRFGLSIETVGYSLLMCWFLALSLIDLDTMTLPNPLTQSGLVLGLVFQVVVGYLDTHSFGGIREHLIQGIFGMVLGIWIYDTIQFVGTWMLGQSAQGGGDAKLMAMVGAWLGWKSVLLSGFLASLCGSIVMGGALILGMIKRRQQFPLGPFIAIGATMTLFAGDWLINTYQRVTESIDRNLLFMPLLISLIGLFIWLRKTRDCSHEDLP
jgi:leader peptidase (prepilin peptidase) / N-methyltransferase